MADKKQSKKDRQKELRQLERQLAGGGSGIDYTKVSDRHVDDKRYERELQHKTSLQSAPYGAVQDDSAPSAAYDAFMRMQTGQGERTIADKINDPNRMTWDQFKKDNADKLDLGGDELKKMVEYRKQLDKERDAALARGVQRKKASKADDSSDDSASSDSDSDADKKHKRKHSSSSSKRKKHKREKKDSKKSSKKHHSKKHKRRRRSSEGSDDNSGDSSSSEPEGDSRSRKHHKKESKKHKESKKEAHSSAEHTHTHADPQRLSAFLQGSDSDSST